MAEMKAEMSVSQVGDSNSKIGQHKSVRVLKDISTVLVEFVDKDGTKQTKLAFIIAGEVRFISEDALSGPVTKWLSDQILIALGMTPKKD